MGETVPPKHSKWPEKMIQNGLKKDSKWAKKKRNEKDSKWVKNRESEEVIGRNCPSKRLKIGKKKKKKIGMK